MEIHSPYVNHLIMTGNITFTMIKPTAVRSGNAGAILAMIQEGGFRIIAMKMTKLTEERARQFYGVHEGKPFFESLVHFMSSGPIVAAILTKEDAVASFRNLIGPTNPAEAPEGTVRHYFGLNIQENAVHGSDSDDNARREASFFFSDMERF